MKFLVFNSLGSDFATPNNCHHGENQLVLRPA